jgi:Tfp pilus assembly protein PilZ
MSENRKQARTSKELKAEIHTNDGMTFSTSVDISIAGVFISTPEPHKPGTEMSLRIKTDDSEFIDIKGVVRWNKDDGEDSSEKLGMGIEFIGITPPDMEKINLLLNS